MLADPILQGALLICGAVVVVCWLLSVVTGNYSQVDRLWSVTPPVYVGYFALQSNFQDLRLDLMFALTALWGARLTYNFARKGGYRWKNEDYRWPVLRMRFGKVLFQIFNATFIAPYQNVLLLLIAIPAYVAVRHPRPMSVLDLIVAAAFVAFLAGETIADQQQWNFHHQKERGQVSGFLQTGLFRYSRHPNFFCEQAQWWCIYLFSVIASGQWLTIALIGPVLLTLLFQGSTNFTEKISAGKYSSYADYQRRTSRLLPLPPKT